MGFLSRLASLINGASPNQKQGEVETQTHENKTNASGVFNEDVKGKETEESAVGKQQVDGLSKIGKMVNLQSHSYKDAQVETIDEETIHETEDMKLEESHTESPKTYTEDKMLYSESLSEQRYAWHKFLLSLLSAVETDNVSNLRYFTIYIRRIAGCRYQWNDEAFKRELLSALEPYDCASHIGAATLDIDVVSDIVFLQMSAKSINDTQFKQQFDDIILFGSKKETTEQKFATAIDKRAFVINELLKKLRNSTGTDTKLMENLIIVAIRNEEDDDMAKYDWVGKRFEDDLRRELTNAFLDNIGSKSIQIVLKPKSETEGCICLIDNQVYYKWGNAEGSQYNTSKDITDERIIATLSIIEGTGSMAKPVYRLDSDIKKTYHIGRGVTSRNDGKYRVNDIVIKDKEADQELLQCNKHVSSAHADIVFKNNKYYIKAAIGGCRAMEGSPTKVVRDENATELTDTTLLYPLEDGDIIELGKSVLLIFSLSDDKSSIIVPDERETNNAMSVDDSF